MARVFLCPGPRPRACSDSSRGLEPQPEPSLSATDCDPAEPAPPTPPARRHRSARRPPPPARPRSPTPRAGRRTPRPGLYRQRRGPAQSAAQPGPVALGNRRTWGRAAGGGGAARASGPVPGEQRSHNACLSPLLTPQAPCSPHSEPALLPLEPQNFPNLTLHLPTPLPPGRAAPLPLELLKCLSSLVPGVSLQPSSVSPPQTCLPQLQTPSHSHLSPHP